MNQYLDIETDRISNKTEHSPDGAEGCHANLPACGPYPALIPTAQATESDVIDLISRWVLENPAALSLSTTA